MSPAGADWVLASSNPGKLAEYRELLADLPIRLRALDPSAADLPAETGASFVENALIKARHAAGVAGAAALADDSGLCVAALGDAPGVNSARYAGSGASDAQNIERLLQALAAVPEAERRATFWCVLVALREPGDPVPVIAAGRWTGRIAAAPSGSQGFGYDPVFYLPELGCTVAELPPQTKNRLSHRASACRELRRQLGF